jgi:RNA polymerase sigma-70 factor (ECF subfamily)
MPRVEAPADATLVARAQDGDLDAFAELVRRHESRVRGVLVRLLDDDRDVEEAVQDTFVQAWRHLDRFRGEAQLFTWLYRIATNEAFMRRRRKRLQTTELDEETVGGAAGPETATETSDVRDFLLARIRELPFEYRAPLVLRDVEGLTNQEVADVLDISLAAAKSRIHRARMRIRTALEEWEEA